MTLLAYTVLVAAVVAYGIGAPAPDWIHADSDTSLQVGIFYGCSDAPNDCTKYDASDLNSCANGNTNQYSVGMGKSNCQMLLASEAFSIMTLIFSALAVLVFCFHSARPQAGAGLSLVACLFGIITTAIFVNWEPDGGDKIHAFVSNDDFKYGYAFGFFIVGIMLSFGGFVLGVINKPN